MVSNIDKEFLDIDKHLMIVACYVTSEGPPAYMNLEMKDRILILEEQLLQHCPYEKENVDMVMWGTSVPEQSIMERLDNYVHTYIGD